MQEFVLKRSLVAAINHLVVEKHVWDIQQEGMHSVLGLQHLKIRIFSCDQSSKHRVAFGYITLIDRP